MRAGSGSRHSKYRPCHRVLLLPASASRRRGWEDEKMMKNNKLYPSQAAISLMMMNDDYESCDIYLI